MILQSVIIPILLISLIQLGINLGFGSIISERFVKKYKILSYIVFIGFAVSLPLMEAIRMFLALGGSDAPDVTTLSFDSLSILFRMWNLILMIVMQIIFNQVILKRLMLKRFRTKANH